MPKERKMNHQSNRKLSFVLAALALAALACTLGGADTGVQQTAEALAAQLTVISVSGGTATDDAALLEETATDAPTEALSDTPQPTATSVPPSATNVPPANTTAPTSTPNLPDWPLVRQGDTGPEVFAVQYLLRSHGYNLTPDGIFGPQTNTRVREFQQDKGLQVDGIVGPQTWTRLIQGKNADQGDTGFHVRAIQHLLSDKFDFNVDVDGIFGPQTDDRVRKFQAAKGLLVDGIVGPVTWKALITLDPN
jgi:peptidoglycan hydrolase-like protein with peptidoglycan-binding domain